MLNLKEGSSDATQMNEMEQILEELEALRARQLALNKQYHEHMNEQLAQLNADHLANMARLQEQDDEKIAQLIATEKANEEQRNTNLAKLIAINKALKSQIEENDIKIERLENKLQDIRDYFQFQDVVILIFDRGMALNDNRFNNIMRNFDVIRRYLNNRICREKE